MIPETIYSKYSQAMFDIAREQQQLDAFGTELKGVRDVFQENGDLWKFINHPLVPPQSKKDTLSEIFKDSVSPLVMQFMYVMIDRRREAALLLAIDGFIDLARKANNIEVAKIRVVKPLTKEEEAKLVAGLEAMTGHRIEPLYYIDPSLIVGMVIQIGDKLIDGSLKRQLKDMQHSLLQAEVTNGVTNE